MTERHYDVVVLGTSIGALVSAALLARRSFRVLLLGHGSRPSSYRFGPHVLRRSARTLLFASSPAFRRVLVELAQSQTFRRRVFALDPMVTAIFARRRFELPPDRALFEREIEREFPETRRAVGELYAELSAINAAADAAFEQDVVLPPGTFWERRRAARLLTVLPELPFGVPMNLLADLPAGDDYRRLVTELARFAAHVAAPEPAPPPLDGADLGAHTAEPPSGIEPNRGDGLPPFALARLHGAWTRGVLAFPRGEDDLVEFFLERIASHGGACRPRERASRLGIGRSGGLEITIDGEASPTGASFLVFDGPGEALADLSRGEGILRRAEREWPAIVPARGRFVVSFIVRAPALPAALGRESFLLTDPAAAGGSSDGDPWDALHLVRMDPCAEPDAPEDARSLALLLVEALVPLGGVAGASALSTGRERILAALERAFPFFGRHLVVIDSPHDGRPLWLYEDGVRREVDRVYLERGSLGAEPMSVQYHIAQPGFHGLSGEPLRGPIARTFLVGETVLPALGQEGQVLAATGAALIVTRSDRHKERMRRAMWSRVEIG